MPPIAPTPKDPSATLGFEGMVLRRGASLQGKAALRSLSAARQHKHVVLGQIFLKYISNTFEENHAKRVVSKGGYDGLNPEDQDEPSGARPTAMGRPKGERRGANRYKAENIFWVP